MNRTVGRISNRHVRSLLAILLIAGLLPAIGWTTFAAGSGASIEGQDGWSGGIISIVPGVDQSLDRSGHNARTGQGSWRISNNTALGNHNGGFAGWPFGPGLSVSAGQPSSGAGADQFRATVWFRSASATADGSYIEIDLGSAAGDDRNTNLSLQNKADNDGGLLLRVNQWVGSINDFRPAIIATGISRTEWHRLDIVANFRDGSANDTVQYALDGSVLANPAGGTTFDTYEGYFESVGQAYVSSNRLFFRSNAKPSALGAFADATAQGFYFDDMTYFVAQHSAPASLLAVYGTGFETGMSAGSIQGPDGWSGGTMPISASVDQAVDQSSPNHRTGQGSWRISNNGYNGNFSGWPFAPGLPVAAGESDSGAEGDLFTATLWFRSASASGDGSNIEIDLGTVPGDDRNTFLALTNKPDAAGGLQLRAGEPDGASVDFRPTVVIAKDISRTEWHRLDIVARFQNGSTNDTVEYLLDGVSLENAEGRTTFKTFEGYREGERAQGKNSPYALSNRLFFRSGAAPSGYGGVDNMAQGFYFDDLSYSVSRQSAPGTPLASYATGFEPAAIPAQDLTVSMTHSGTFVQGQVGAQYTLTATNSGSPWATGDVTVATTLPVGLTPTAAIGTGWDCTIGGLVISCSRSDALAPGASYAPITITVDVAANAPASLTATATVSGGGEINTANDTTTDVATVLAGVFPADLAIAITDGRLTYLPGTPIGYTVTVTNAGPSTATGVSVMNDVPAGIRNVTVSCSITGSGTCGANGTSGNSVLFTSASLNPGEKLTLTVMGTVRFSASGMLVNTAAVAAGAATTDVNLANNWAVDEDQPETVIVNDRGDFDGDGKADIATFQPSTSEWHIRYSSSPKAGELVVKWGGLGDVPAIGDYDGDGKSDIAVFRPSTSEWHILKSSTWTPAEPIARWGGMGDIPVVGDYDGDGKTDIAVFRPSTGDWHILKSSTWTPAEPVLTWGGMGDVPTVGDYDGDGKTDIAVFRPSSGEWYVFNLSTWTAEPVVQYGGLGDIPTARDYDGDGKTDIAVFRPSTSEWHILKSSTWTSADPIMWGGLDDIPMARDYDGDGKADIAIFRPSTGEWFVLNSGTWQSSDPVVTFGRGRILF